MQLVLCHIEAALVYGLTRGAYHRSEVSDSRMVYAGVTVATNRYANIPVRNRKKDLKHIRINRRNKKRS